jgi:hypothetical protein
MHSKLQSAISILGDPGLKGLLPACRASAPPAAAKEPYVLVLLQHEWLPGRLRHPLAWHPPVALRLLFSLPQCFRRRPPTPTPLAYSSATGAAMCLNSFCGGRTRLSSKDQRPACRAAEPRPRAAGTARPSHQVAALFAGWLVALRAAAAHPLVALLPDAVQPGVEGLRGTARAMLKVKPSNTGAAASGGCLRAPR